MPFFFAIAGYFWGKKVRSGNELTKVSLGYGRRILRIWAVWSLIYLLVPNDVESFRQCGISALVKVPYWRLRDLIGAPIQSLFVGSALHLWFLMALLWALAICSVVLKYGREKWLIWIGCALSVFGLVAGSWSVAFFGSAIPFQTKNGPFFGTIFFAMGWYLSSDKVVISPKLVASLLLGGLAMHGLELYLLWSRFGVSPSSHAYVAGTLFWGAGFTLLVMSRPSFGKGTIMAKVGKYTLGIYLVHYVFVQLFAPLFHAYRSRLWDIVVPIVVFLVSLLAAMAIQRNRLLRRVLV
jgi:peptidoglycan/LPS O-acetylase OafA/YrhL